MEIRVLRGQTQPTAPPTTDVVANGPAGGPIGRLREPETQRCAWPADCLAWSSTDTRHRALLANLRPRDTKGRHSCVEQRGLAPWAIECAAFGLNLVHPASGVFMDPR